jgi:hypothetical protein
MIRTKGERIYRRRPISWAQSLSAGMGFLLTGTAMAGLWLLARYASGSQHHEPQFLIVPAILLGAGLVYLIRGVVHRLHDGNPAH